MEYMMPKTTEQDLAEKAAAATSAAPLVATDENDGLAEIMAKVAQREDGNDEQDSGEQQDEGEESSSESGESETGEAGEEGDGGKEPAELEEADQKLLGKLPPEVQQSVNSRIGQLVAAKKEAEERATEAEAKLAEQTKDPNQADAAVSEIAPEYLSKDEAKLITEYQQIGAFEKWLLENFDGYQGAGTPEDPSYEAAAIRRRYGEVVEKRRIMGVTAERLLVDRRKQMQMDMAEGRKLRLQREQLKLKKPDTKPAAPKTVVAKSKTQVSKTPLSPAARTGFDKKALMEKGPTREGLQAAFENAMG